MCEIKVYSCNVNRLMDFERKMKKLVLVFTALILGLNAAFAGDNFLNTVILEGSDGGYNVILRTDEIASVKKTVNSNNKITLDVKGVTSSNSISTLYKNTSQANTIIVENVGSNAVKIQINADNIANSNIIFDTPASAPVVVSDSVSHNTIVWSIIAFIALFTVFAKSRSIKEDSSKVIREAIEKDLRDREIQMYKTYKKEMLTIPSIDYKIKNPRVQETIRRADTIRHMQRLGK